MSSKYLVYFIFGFLTLITLSNCTKNNDAQHYIHVAHTRIFDTINQVIDPRMEAINYDKFDMVLLGGDLCEESSKRYDILEYLDGVFDLDSPTTLWALGNHDNARLDFVEKATKRPYFYTTHHNGITFVVLYTQEKEDWICTITGDQLKLLEQVTDTISESSHLVVMTHKLIWLRHHPEMSKHIGTNPYNWSCNYLIARNNWYKDIVPMLQSVEEGGIEVIALAGDIGNNVLEFEEHTSDGIDYLASGSNPEKKDVKFLLFKHNLITKNLSWEFIPLEEFLEDGQRID